MNRDLIRAIVFAILLIALPSWIGKEHEILNAICYGCSGGIFGAVATIKLIARGLDK